MAVEAEGTIVLTKSVPNILYTAPGGSLPGIFSGKINARDITNVADIVNMKVETKYSSGGSFQEGENRDFQQSDGIARMAPTEETYGYQITLELLAASPSASVTLAYMIFRSSAPT